MICKRTIDRAAVLASGALLALLITMNSQPRAVAAPMRPADDSFVLATVPQTTGAQSPLRTAQAALANEPDNVDLAVAAARIGIEQGRSRADPRFYGQAQAALAPWWDKADPPEQVRVLRAVILQAFHDFAAAAADLDAILRQSPNNAQARLSRAFVRMVVGDFEAAAEDCASLPRAIEPIIAQICGARIEALTGAADRAYLRLGRSLAIRPPAQPAMHKFTFAVMAELAIAMGRDGEAEKLYAQAAAIGDPDASLLASHADLLLDLNRPAEALKLLEDKGEADILLLRRAIAAKRANDPRLASWSNILSERFRLEVLGETPQALALAIENWRVQKEPADARLLIECAMAARQPEAAADVAAFVARTGIKDARIAKPLARLKETRT
jgi:hypothetical protein